jgi:hypothetical protein
LDCALSGAEREMWFARTDQIFYYLYSMSRLQLVLILVLWMIGSLTGYAQGRIQLSNIGKALITVDETPAPGGTLVQLATESGDFVGRQVKVLEVGFFAAGTTTLEGVGGLTTLLLAASADEGHTWFYSDPFDVLLNTGPVLGAPDASIPSTFSGVNIVTIPEPSSFALLGVGGLTVLLFRRKCVAFPSTAKSFD